MLIASTKIARMLGINMTQTGEVMLFRPGTYTSSMAVIFNPIKNLNIMLKQINVSAKK